MFDASDRFLSDQVGNAILPLGSINAQWLWRTI